MLEKQFAVAPRETQESSHFVPVEDRWRVGFPSWDRYGNGHSCTSARSPSGVRTMLPLPFATICAGANTP